MPNYITNILKVEASNERTMEILEFIKSDENGVGSIDFNKITPTPKWVFQGNLGKDDIALYGAENCWLDWNRKNWGVKWNAIDKPHERNTENSIVFFTAWSGVLELMRKLGWLFPDAIFDYYWADEDIGSNVGSATFKGLDLISVVNPKSRSDKAYRMALEIDGSSLEENCMLGKDAKGKIYFRGCKDCPNPCNTGGGSDV